MITDLLSSPRKRGSTDRFPLPTAGMTIGAVLFFAASFSIASAPVNNLPGVVDADQWKHPSKARAKSNPPPPVPIPTQLSKVHAWVMGLNQVPEPQLTEKSGPAAIAIAGLRNEDGPDFAKLRTLLGRGDVRKKLNPGAKGMLAEQLSPRWDAFTLAGNLWLGALQSENSDISAMARLRLVHFIQPAHVPVLINLLKVPGPNVLAYEILQEVTGQRIKPNMAEWGVWWKKTQGNPDVVGHVLNQSRSQLRDAEVQPIDPARFWYAPDRVSRTDRPYDNRSSGEQKAIGEWSDMARSDVKRYLDQWARAKPLLERIVHQPDPRVGAYLKTLLQKEGMADYMAVVLAWRGDRSALELIQDAATDEATVGRMLALGSLGDKTALQYLLKLIELRKAPLSYGLMDNELRGYALKLPTLGVISAEQAFELLAHQRFGFVDAVSAKEKKKAVKKAKQWLTENYDALKLDRRHGYYVNPLKMSRSPHEGLAQ